MLPMIEIGPELMAAEHERLAAAGIVHAVRRLMPRRIVLFGAGLLGRRVLAALAEAGIEVAAVLDNSAERHGGSCEGVPVLAPAEAPALAPDLVIVASDAFYQPIRAQLDRLFAAAPARPLIIGLRGVGDWP